MVSYLVLLTQVAQLSTALHESFFEGQQLEALLLHLALVQLGQLPFRDYQQVSLVLKVLSDVCHALLHVILIRHYIEFQ